MEDPDRRDIAERYRLLWDLHTHTVYSHGVLYAHGKGTILENAEAAVRKGIEELAISDHGPGHRFYGLKMKKLPRMREEIRAAERTFPGLKVWLSVEANIIDTENGLDVPEEDIPKFDFINAGYHYGLPRGNMTRNQLASHRLFPSGSTERLRNDNTEMVLRALYRNPIRILTHPGDKGPFDIAAIAKACEETGTLMEINTRHRHLTEEELHITEQYDVRYIISSDAHSPERIGDFEEGVLRAMRAGVDIGKIVNVAAR